MHEDVHMHDADAQRQGKGVFNAGPWPGLPPMSAPLSRAGDCAMGIGPQEYERWGGSIKRPRVLRGLTLNQHHKVQTLGWRNCVMAGKPLPECAKWNGTQANLLPRPRSESNFQVRLALVTMKAGY